MRCYRLDRPVTPVRDSLQPLFADRFPGVFPRFIMGVLCKTSGKRRIAQQTNDICGKSFFIAYGREQSGAFVLDQIRHALRRSGDHGSSRRKGFDNRKRHVVEPRGVDEDIGLIVIFADFLTRRYSGEVDTGEIQIRNQFADIAFERAIADQIELRFGIFLFNFRKRSDDNIHAVILGEAAGADQVRSQRNALAITELREIDDVGHSRCRESEVAENIDQVARRNDNFVDAREHKLRRAKALQVVAGFATVVVDRVLLPRIFATNDAGAGASRNDQ